MISASPATQLDGWDRDLRVALLQGVDQAGQKIQQKVRPIPRANPTKFLRA
jgi:hypothetical protein